MKKVLMLPELSAFRSDESGIKRVVENYCKYLPEFGYKVVDQDTGSYDIVASHAGANYGSTVVHCHGLYWSADYHAAKWEWMLNAHVITAIRLARETTVPSRWVQESFQRDMRFSPHVIGHGIDWEEWQGNYDNNGYVLWNKNRASDACNPAPAINLARLNSSIEFVTTFSSHKLHPDENVTVIGLQPHDKMKKIVQSASVYLSTTKETFGIGTLEALASGVPVLGFAYGGNLDLVQHGVNGYLAQPGNIEDLNKGLIYCRKYRSVLSVNAREMAKEWSWRNAVEKVAAIYDLAQNYEEPSVAVIIPSYNYADKVGKAIESVLNQSRKADEIIVVDDGSDDGDDTRSVTERFSSQDNRVRYIRQENQGVAIARNTGISNSRSKYIVCLDADDAIAPKFIEVCLDALERDRSLGIAYTGLWAIKPNGEEGLSPWPGEFDYDQQIMRRNQVPTCCMFRRKMWERLGGYKQRYAPHGAGAEDAEFFLRAGAYGWNAKKVTNEGLFIYSWMSGRVSGDRNYREVDWTSWHPWVKDHKHPFASLATPENKISHPVRQYDEPTISVIIPVGEGHEEEVINALDSLEAQTLRKWEAIVVDDTGRGFFNEDVWEAYPYVKFVKSNEKGAGAARNAGARAARAPLLLFLDADDWLYPEALQKLYDAWQINNAISYSDYVGKVYLDDEGVEKLKEKILYYDEKRQEAVMNYQSFEYSYERAIQQPDPRNMYIWNLISSLVPRSWHNEIGGFDENMESWEDWDYWIRLARAGKCFVRVPEPLVVYRFYTGTRRDTGIRENQKLIQYLRNKYEGTEIKMCNCSGNRSVPVSQQTVTPPPTGSMKMASMKDEDMVLVLFDDGNRGQHKIIGQATRTFYGYRGSGAKFLVHRRDIDLQPHIFKVLNERPAVSNDPVDETPPPALIRREPTSVAEAIDQSLENDDDEKPIAKVRRFDLQTIPGVTKTIELQMHEVGINTPEDILAFGKKNLVKFKGVAETRAEMMLEYINDVYLAQESDE